MTLKEFLNAVENGDKIRKTIWDIIAYIFYDKERKSWIDENGVEYDFNAYNWHLLDNFELYKEPELTQEELKVKYNFNSVKCCKNCESIIEFKSCLCQKTGINFNHIKTSDFICDAWEGIE